MLLSYFNKYPYKLQLNLNSIIISFFMPFFFFFFKLNDVDIEEEKVSMFTIF